MGNDSPYSPPHTAIGSPLEHRPHPNWLRRLRIGVIITNSLFLIGSLSVWYGYIQAGIQKDGHPFGNAYFYLGGMFVAVCLFTVFTLTVGMRNRLAKWLACGAILLVAIQSTSELLGINGTSIDPIGYLIIMLFLAANLIAVSMWYRPA